MFFKRRSKSTVENLIRARRLITNRHDWWGFGNGSGAYAMCAAQSLSRVVLGHDCYDRLEGRPEIAMLANAARRIFGRRRAGDVDMVVYANDHLGHAAVLKMYDEAIAMLQEGKSTFRTQAREEELVVGGD